MYRIWCQVFKGDELVCASMSAKEYVRKGNAERAAKQHYDNMKSEYRFEWTVSEKNPWSREE